MKRQLIARAFSAFFVILLCVGLMRSGQAASDSLVRNGGFEVAAKTWEEGQPPTGWGIWQLETLKRGEVALDHRVKHGENCSVRFRDATHELHQIIPVKPGEIYTLRCYVKTRLEAGGCGLAVHWLTAQGKWVFEKDGKASISHNCNLFEVVNEWREARLTNVRVPDTAVSAWVSVGPVFGARGEFWVDDVEMQPAHSEEATDYHATVTVGKIERPPKLEGTLNEPLWEDLPAIANFSVPKLQVLARRQTSVKLACDTQALYLGVRCEEPKPDQRQVLEKKRDGAVWADDCVEVFLAPQGPWQKHFHFAVNPAGTPFEAVERWEKGTNNVSSDVAWNPEWTVATRSGPDAWTVTARIPFADMGVVTPASGTRWGFNVTRHRCAGEEYSSWSPLKDLTFQRSECFGELVFSESPITVHSYGVSSNQASVLIRSPEQKTPVAIRIESWDGGKLWTLASRQVEVEPRIAQTVAVPLGQADTGFVWITVSSGGQVLYREGYIPLSEYASIGCYDPENVLGNKLYVACDLRTFKPFQTNHSFEGGIGGPRLIYRSQKPVDLYFELPASVRATHLSQGLINWMYWEPIVPSEKTPFTRNNRPCVRYRFELPAIMGYNMNTVAVFFETTLPPGAKETGYCYLKWDAGQQPPRRLDIEALNIGRTPALKKFVNGIYYAEAELLLTWLPDLAQVYPRLGLNRIEIDPQPGIVYGPGGQVVQREKWFDQLVDRAREGHLYMATSPCKSTPWFQNWTGKDPEARAINAKGEPIKDVRWSDTYSLCPLYRGKFFQEHVDMFTRGAAFSKYHVSWLALDLELWTDEAWDEGCFCGRCLAAFRKYADGKLPAEALGAPREFMKNPEAHPRERKVWQEFRGWCISDMVRAFRLPLEAAVAAHKSQTSPKPGLAVSEWRGPSPELFSVVDYFEVSLYRKPEEVARRLAAALRAAKGRKNIMGTPSTGQTFGLDATITPEDMRYSIFECAVAGVQGMIWYEVMGLDALKLKTMVEGIRTIQPFEEIILNGQCLIDVPCKGATASARGITLGRESLMLVRAYDGHGKVEARATAPSKDKAVVYDCLTREALGPVTPQKPEVVVPITRERARLLYVGPEAGWRKRIAG